MGGSEGLRGSSITEPLPLHASPLLAGWCVGLRMRPGSATTSGVKRRMAEDGKEEPVATDDDPDHTAAEGSYSLNDKVNSDFSFLLLFVKSVRSPRLAAGKGCVNLTVYLLTAG